MIETWISTHYIALQSMCCKHVLMSASTSGMPPTHSPRRGGLYDKRKPYNHWLWALISRVFGLTLVGRLMELESACDPNLPVEASEIPWQVSELSG